MAFRVAAEPARHRNAVRLEEAAQRLERRLREDARRGLAAIDAGDQRARCVRSERHAEEPAVTDAAPRERRDAYDGADLLLDELADLRLDGCRRRAHGPKNQWHAAVAIAKPARSPPRQAKSAWRPSRTRAAPR